MKKVYMEPQVVVAEMEMMSVICMSNGVTSERGIDYGGVDEEGTKEPSARRRNDIWEDEPLDEE